MFQIAVGVLASGLAVAGCGGSPPHEAEGQSPTTAPLTSPSSAAPALSTATTVTPTVATPGATTTAAPGASTTLPISVQTDSQMQSAGNDGPSSSILAPTSCNLVGPTLTAAGGYTNGGFAPNVYNRYGDVVELYAYTGPSDRGQVAELNSERRPPIGGYGTWHVSASINASIGIPSTCVVAAQPTHAVQLAP
jgi:hypothetical protein